MKNMFRRMLATFFIAILIVGTANVTNADAALKKPGNCRFVGWNNTAFTSCRIAWNHVSGIDAYEIKWCYTDGSHAKVGYQYADKNVVDITGLAYNHVYQAQVRGVIFNADYTKIVQRTPWSNLVFITPFPKSVNVTLPKTKENQLKLKWNIIYGSSGYNVFMTTNPKGTWYWNQSTPQSATATTGTVKKYRGSKLKMYTNYYVRIVTRRKRNGVFCTVPAPYNSYAQWGGTIMYR